MATGVQTHTSPRYVMLRVVDGTAVDVAAPSTAAHGIEMPHNPQAMQVERVAVSLTDRSGTGTLTVTYAKIWGYLIGTGKWYPLGSGTDANRGKLNDGVAIGEVASDDLRLIELVSDLTLFDRVQIELNGVGGTSPVIDADLFIPLNFARYRN